MTKFVGDKVKREIVDELHRQARKNFIRRRVYVKGIDDLWQIDLADLSAYAKSNRGYKYILTVIDVLSKFAWSVPLSNKTGETVTEGMRKVLKQSYPRVPTNLQCDRGKEFYNSTFQKLMKAKRINQYSTFTHLKASVVERFNRTLKQWMWKEFSVQGNYKWLDMLPRLMTRYNSRVHHTTAMRPVDVKAIHQARLLKKLNVIVNNVRNRKFSSGDIVRISKYKTLFGKGYTPSWSTELFTVNRIRDSKPPVYYLRDVDGQPIKGAFYAEELQKTRHPDTYLVERVLKRKADKVYVKWLGFDSRHNSWI